MCVRAYGLLCHQVDRMVCGRAARTAALLPAHDAIRLCDGLAGLRRHASLAIAVPAVSLPVAMAIAEFEGRLPWFERWLRHGRLPDEPLELDALQGVLAAAAQLLDAVDAAVAAWAASSGPVVRSPT